MIESLARLGGRGELQYSLNVKERTQFCSCVLRDVLFGIVTVPVSYVWALFYPELINRCSGTVSRIHRFRVSVKVPSEIPCSRSLWLFTTGDSGGSVIC